MEPPTSWESHALAGPWQNTLEDSFLHSLGHTCHKSLWIVYYVPGTGKTSVNKAHILMGCLGSSSELEKWAVEFLGRTTDLGKAFRGCDQSSPWLSGDTCVETSSTSWEEAGVDYTMWKDWALRRLRLWAKLGTTGCYLECPRLRDLVPGFVFGLKLLQVLFFSGYGV